MTYEMGGTILSITDKEKDLGVTMNANMKVSEQCRIAASKAGTCNFFQVTGQITTLKWSRGPDNVTHVNEG